MLIRRTSYQSNGRKQPNQGSQDQESSTREQTPEPELKNQQSIVSSASGVKKPIMNEAELDEKIKDFAGAKREVDAKTNELLGKLLIDEADEDVNPDRETYSKLWALVGGPIPVLLFVLYA